MKIIFLGTNGWYDSSTGNTICTYLQTDKYNIVLDAGYGFSKLSSYIRRNIPTFLFLSHFHLDHTVGLHTLNTLSTVDKIHIFGPIGTKKFISYLVNPPFSASLDKLPFDVEIFELPNDCDKLPFPIKTLPLNHVPFSLGYRFYLDDKIITYCTDTGYCENIISLALNADVLIIECALRHGEENPFWPHLNPETALAIGRTAGVRRIVLTHFDAQNYPTLNDRLNIRMHLQDDSVDYDIAVDNMDISV